MASFTASIFFPANRAELRAFHDQLDGNTDVVVVGGKFRGHVFEQRFVGKLDAAAERVAEKFAAELMQESVAAFCEEIIAHAVEAIELRAVGEFRAGIDCET